MITLSKKFMLVLLASMLSMSVYAKEVLRLGHYFPTEDFRGKTAQYFADQLNSDAFDVKVYPSESLVKGRDGFMATARGTVDIYSLFGGYAVGSVDLMRIFTIPFPSKSMTDSKLLEFANDPRVLDILGKRFETSQVKLLGFVNSSGETTVFLADPISSIKEFSGKRIRGVGGYTDPVLQDLGASVVFMSAAEQFLQLQTGGVDGVITTNSSYANLGLATVAPARLERSIVRTPYALLMNLRKWNRLDESEQQAVREAVRNTIAWSAENFDAESERLAKIVESQSKTVISFKEDDEQLINSLTDKYMQEFASTYGDDAGLLVEVLTEYNK
ncbi:TRAP transporter substrate-binding protein [Marinobacterium iners]|uniref:TRAP-type C4-dicarboxylate transport system, substrate-binding protein n=1 Tax=Marinobacterium iners DSM 11526 TaxID=1122198 RepID=A0A1H3XSV5_9GAMM|nr:TRAP transporter substrate-binding protein DctP [Marinobacterium iners]SEA02525.1 TRAP-type C4-dicarboxylate transport system, substrate-binding protein [Marinobacterium iners DSM 11526]